MRRADVFVSMHGGDVINGLHLHPGRAVIELVNHGFHQASWLWLNQYFRVLKHTLFLDRLVLAPPPGSNTAGTAGNWSKAKGLAAWSKQVNRGWNVNSSVSWEELKLKLVAIIDRASCSISDNGVRIQTVCPRKRSSKRTKPARRP